MSLGTVTALRRYPVKSLRGEDLERMEVNARGPVGDRLWALVDGDGKLASGKDSRRFRKVPGLLEHASRMDGDVPVLVPAAGDPVRGDAPEVGAAVQFIAGPGWRLAREERTPHHDASPILLVTSATLARLGEDVGSEVESQRLRPNIVVEVPDSPGFVEDAWVGCELAIEGVRLRVAERCERCVMVNHAQPGGLDHRPKLLKQIGRSNDACAGVYADVMMPGTLRVGAAVDTA
ncbi:MAG TPA: MOSC N-terminal beta barrel domain-containing protein [Thermoleophilaceae bacterium]|nr:MOSC N-terminal beta barrel domain-containing protein [Thermoleophilaceae bacterium]